MIVSIRRGSGSQAIPPQQQHRHVDGMVTAVAVDGCGWWVGVGGGTACATPTRRGCTGMSTTLPGRHQPAKSHPGASHCRRTQDPGSQKGQGPGDRAAAVGAAAAVLLYAHSSSPVCRQNFQASTRGFGCT